MNEDQVKVFERFAEDIQKQYEAVGIAVSVFDKDKVLYRKNFGYRDLETKAPIDNDTIFGCASISKSFTALSVMQLAEEQGGHQRSSLQIYPRIQGSPG